MYLKGNEQDYLLNLKRSSKPPQFVCFCTFRIPNLILFMLKYLKINLLTKKFYFCKLNRKHYQEVSTVSSMKKHFLFWQLFGAFVL